MDNLTPHYRTIIWEFQVTVELKLRNVASLGSRQYRDARLVEMELNFRTLLNILTTE